MKKKCLFALIIGVFIFSACGKSESNTQNSSSLSEERVTEEGYWLQTEIISITDDDLEHFDNILEKESVDVSEKVELIKNELINQRPDTLVNLLYMNKNKFESFNVGYTEKSKDVSGTYSVDENYEITPIYKNKKYSKLENNLETETTRDDSSYDMEYYQSYENRIYSVPNEKSRGKLDNNNFCAVYSRISDTDGKELIKLISEFKLSDSSTSSTEVKTEPSSAIQQSSSLEDKSDITNVSENPTSEQIEILQELAEQEFSNQFPYKGSKIKSILGVVQPWTESNGRWFYKSEAVIVNQFGAKQDTTVEVYIAPISATSGDVEIIAY